MENDGQNTFVLGIDTGTTSVKVSLVNVRTRDVVESVRSETSASISGKQSDCAEQDVAAVIFALEHALRQLTLECLAKVVRIEVCGQMHGCMLWKGSSCWKWNLPDQAQHSSIVAKKAVLKDVSDLITWEDRRCTKDFLSTLPSTRTDVAISTGFGCASLFWLQRNDPSLLEQFDSAGTVMDFIVCMLCGMDKPFMSSHNAVSWGYFDLDTMTWEVKLLESANFPTRLLPVVQKPGFVAGRLQGPLLSIPARTPVGVALGDFQCSVLATISHPDESAVLNIGTSCQLAVVIPDDISSANIGQVHCSADCPSGATQLLPFFKGRKVITAASLSGGNTLATFVKMLTSWLEDLGVRNDALSTDDIYQKILHCADKKGSTSLKVVPTLWGERHTPDKKGEICNITSDNISLGDVGLALSKGLLQNMTKMMSRDFLVSHGVQRIVGTGSALLRNPVLQKQVEQVFGLPLVIRESADASVGAALAVVL